MERNSTKKVDKIKSTFCDKNKTEKTIAENLKQRWKQTVDCYSMLVKLQKNEREKFLKVNGMENFQILSNLKKNIVYP